MAAALPLHLLDYNCYYRESRNPAAHSFDERYYSGDLVGDF
jgi:hypothetical protein